MLALLPLLVACGTRTGSQLAFTVEDDVEVFEDAAHDGIVVDCWGDRDGVTVEMGRSIFDEDEGPTFHARFALGAPRGPAPDEGVVYDRDAVGLSVGYHGAAWPSDVGEIAVTDFVALDEVVRVGLTVSGLGDGRDVSLDGTVLCVR